MKLEFDNYTVEDANYGWQLTVKQPSDSEKSKTGFTEKVSFHATLAQVADKMARYEVIAVDDVKSIQELIQVMRESSKRLESLMSEILEGE